MTGSVIGRYAAIFEPWFGPSTNDVAWWHLKENTVHPRPGW